MLIQTWMPVTTPNKVQKITANRQAMRRGVMPASLRQEPAKGRANAANRVRRAAKWRIQKERQPCGCLSRLLLWRELREHQANLNAAVAQAAFRGRVVADRLARVAAFDRDAGRVDAVAADEVIADRFSAAAIEIVIRCGVLAVIVVADDIGGRSRLLLHA